MSVKSDELQISKGLRWATSGVLREYMQAKDFVRGFRTTLLAAPDGHTDPNLFEQSMGEISLSHARGWERVLAVPNAEAKLSLHACAYASQRPQRGQMVLDSVLVMVLLENGSKAIQHSEVRRILKAFEDKFGQPSTRDRIQNFSWYKWLRCGKLM